MSTRTITLTLTHRDYYALRMAGVLYQPLTTEGQRAIDRALDALLDAWTVALLKDDEDDEEGSP